MEFNPQQIQEQVSSFVKELIGDKVPEPVPQAAQSTTAGGTEVRISSSGEVVIRVNCAIDADIEPEPDTVTCYIVENNAAIESLQFSPTEERLLAQVMRASGMSRTALLRRLLERAIMEEARRYAAQEFGISE